MTTENTKLAVHTIVKENSEDYVLETIQELKYEFVDESDFLEHGDLDSAYDEVGRGEAESQALSELIKFCGVELDSDESYEVYQALQEIWGISCN